MPSFFEIISSFVSVIKTITLSDIIDIIILSYFLYKGIKLVRETRAQQLIKGIILISVGYLFVRLLNLKVMGFLLENFFQWGILAIIIMFQPELRRVLEKMGRTKVMDINPFSFNDTHNVDTDAWIPAIDAICDAAQDLSSSATGALIVIERQTKLGEQIDTGTILNCIPSASVFGNIFFPNTPLHDGAVIIRDGKILAAGCFLPKPQKEELINKQLGSRHRAAIGMSEISDAIIVVVSEETGTISVAEDGDLTRGFTKESLKKFLKLKLVVDKTNEDKKAFAGKVKSLWKKEN